MSFFKVERGWLDSEVWGGEPYSQREAWAWMIESAEWKEAVRSILGRPVKLKRGQFSHSIRFMAEKFQWSTNRVLRFLEKLKTWNMIDAKSETGQIIITICNYTKYQDGGDSTGDTSGDGVGDTPGDTSGDKEEELKNLRKEEEGRKKERLSRPSSEACEISAPEIQMAVSAYNALADRTGIPRCQKLTLPRQAKLRLRLRDCGGLPGWQSALAKIETNPFFQGGGERGWKADLDFLLQEKSFTRLMEGYYDGGTKNAGKSTANDELRDYLVGLRLGQPGDGLDDGLQDPEHIQGAA